MGINRPTGEPQNWGALELALLGWEAWLIPRFTPLSTCYHVKFGSSAIKGVHINRRNSQNWGALGSSRLEVGAWLTQRSPILGVPFIFMRTPFCRRTTKFDMVTHMAKGLFLQAPRHMCYHVKFSSSATKGCTHKYKWNPQNWGALGHRPLRYGRSWPLEIRSSPRVILPNLVVLGQTQMVKALSSPENLTHRVIAFQCHSRSSEPRD